MDHRTKQGIGGIYGNLFCVILDFALGRSKVHLFIRALSIVAAMLGRLGLVAYVP